MLLQIASIILFDKFNNVYITVLENQFNMAFSHVYFPQLHVSETYTLISFPFSLFPFIVTKWDKAFDMILITFIFPNI